MNIDQIRDEVAEMLGWTYHGDQNPYECHWQSPDGNRQFANPVPTTIDGIAALWPKGWRFGMNMWPPHALRDGDPGCIRAYAHPAKMMKDEAYKEGLYLSTGDFDGTEYEARLRLLHAVLTAERKAAANAVADGEQK